MTVFVFDTAASETLFNFSTFVAEMQKYVKNSENVNSESALRLALFRALSSLSRLRTTFNEETFSFTTSEGEGEYDAATTGFPVAAVEFDLIEAGQEGANELFEEVRPRPLREVRELLAGGSEESAGCPQIYCWHARKLILAPRPNGAYTVRGDYYVDARRDEVTGERLTPSSTTQTNRWLTDGFHLTFPRAMEIYHASFSRDEKAAAMFRLQAQEAVIDLHVEWAKKVGQGIRVEPYI